MAEHFVGIGATLDELSVCDSIWSNDRLIVRNLLRSDNPCFDEIERLLIKIAQRWQDDAHHTASVFTRTDLPSATLERCQKALQRDSGVLVKFEVQKPILSPQEAQTLIGFSLRDGKLGMLQAVDLVELGEAMREIETDLSGKLAGSARAQAIALGLGEPLKLKFQEKRRVHSIHAEFISQPNRFTWDDDSHLPISQRITW